MTMLEERPTEPPAIDPRIRQRWVEARREEGRRRLRVLVIFLSVVAVVAGALGALYSPLFEVRHVRVTFTSLPAGSGLTAAQVRAQAGLDRTRLMVRVSTGPEVALVDALPWVASATVRREWPATVAITVTPRQPVAVADRVPGHPAEGLAVVDRTGRILALRPGGSNGSSGPDAAGGSGTAGAGSGMSGDSSGSSGSSPAVGSAAGLSLPLLAALPASGPAGTWLGGGRDGQLPAAAAHELAVATALGSTLRRQVSAITEGSDGLAVSVGQTRFLFGDTSELDQKVTALETVLADVSLARHPVVDLRVPDRPALTPLPGTH